ncbi:hypothetical protein SPI_03470 [Niveomyces insectorum RCEF 264]|uniref:Uncharacterized protein n=1 Tax=Niveomyces insectorum RCEF 264 TaxID=1081102 RepID=A0A167W3W2_9HYPO|nr:hypothetical protein SPI_03470 [Niveomyces insectorum RCEF 264]
MADNGNNGNDVLVGHTVEDLIFNDPNPHGELDVSLVNSINGDATVAALVDFARGLPPYMAGFSSHGADPAASQQAASLLEEVDIRIHTMNKAAYQRLKNRLEAWHAAFSALESKFAAHADFVPDNFAHEVHRVVSKLNTLVRRYTRMLNKKTWTPPAASGASGVAASNDEKLHRGLCYDGFYPLGWLPTLLDYATVFPRTCMENNQLTFSTLAAFKQLASELYDAIRGF